jgi:lysophospholipase L1-like esterase
MEYLQNKKTVGLPPTGRLIPAKKLAQDTPDDLYPPENAEIKYYSEWTKKQYRKRIKEFKQNPLKFGDVVFLGDSITEGGQDWSKKFGVANVKNRGISGDMTDGVLLRLNEITHFKPKAVFILIGINDLSDKSDETKFLTPQYVADNILKITEIIRRKTPQTKIYLQTILPTAREFTKEKITKVNQVIHANKSGGGYQVIDLHTAFMDQDGFLRKDLTTDGVHLNANGYALWVAQVKPFVGGNM